MKRLIVTRADDNIEEMTEITHPLLEKYADMCWADFDVISDTAGIHPHYRILQIGPMFDKYDRIAVIDSDVLITSKCPDIFKTVPEDHIGTIYEDKGSRLEDRRDRIRKVQINKGSVGWKEGYINTGVCVFSKCHREIFDLDHSKLWLGLGFDDVELKFHIHRLGMKIHELPCEWNFMSMFMEPWSAKSKADAYIIHYAGMGFYPVITRTEQIKQDYLLLRKYGMLI